MHKVIQDQVLLNRVTVMRLRRLGYKTMRAGEYQAIIDQKNQDISMLTSMGDTLTQKIVTLENALIKSNNDLVKALDRLDRAGIVGRDL